jgi:uncharacterized protein
MQTSSGDARTYTRYGRLHLTADDREVTLTLYMDDNTGAFFLPFANGLRGRGTYGAERYLDPEPLGDAQFLVNFNLAYNPYCAYNDDWSCPLTPVEYWLSVPIRAGELMYDHTTE